MDFEELLRWRNLAQSQSKDFWTKVFDSEQAYDFISNFSGDLDEKSKQPSQFPRADVWQSETELIVVIELPGLNKKDVQLQISEDELKIKGMVQSPFPAHHKVSSERFYGSFSRSIKLPITVDKEWASAKFTNGLLRVRFPIDLTQTADTIEIEDE